MFKKSILMLTATMLAFSMSACSAKPPNEAADYSVAAGGAMGGATTNQFAVVEDGNTAEMSNNAKTDMGQINTPSIENISQRKVITTCYYELQTKDFDKTITDLNSKITETESYIQSSSTSGNVSEGDARANFSVRVPTDKYEEFNAFVTKLGNVLHTSENGQDVTGEYFDTETRLKVLYAQENRLVELYEKANIAEIIQLEEQLTSVRTEIERLTTVIKRYDDLIAYTTINISIEQTKDYVLVNDSFLNKISTAFSDSLKWGLNALQTIAVAFIWLLPYLVIVGIILLIIIQVHSKKKKKNAKASLMTQTSPPLETPPTDEDSKS